MWKVIFSIGKFKNHGVGTVFSGNLLLDAIRWKLESFRKGVIRRIFVIFQKNSLSTTLSLVFLLFEEKR